MAKTLFLCAVSLALMSRLTSASPAGQATDLEGLLQNVEKKYSNLNDLRMDFKKEQKSEIFKRSEPVKGKIFLQQPDKYRLESDQEIIVSDGEFMWIYAIENNQVTKQNQKTGEGQNLLGFLKEIRSRYQAESGLEEKLEGSVCQVIVLEPKEKGSDFEKLILWVDGKNYLVRKMKVEDLQGSTTIYRFSNIKLNSGLDEKVFKFTPPQRSEMIDLTEE